MIEAIWNAITNTYGAIFGAVLDPTGMVLTNILAWVAVYACGWYASSMLISGYHFRQAAVGANNEYRCSLQSNLSEYQCERNHDKGCWKLHIIEMPAYRMREVVKMSMGFAVVWPLVVGAAIMFGPWALLGWGIWLAIIQPGVLGTKAVGSGIVTGTTVVANTTVNTIIKRQEDINKHKALTSAKKFSDE